MEIRSLATQAKDEPPKQICYERRTRSKGDKDVSQECETTGIWVDAFKRKNVPRFYLFIQRNYLVHFVVVLQKFAQLLGT